MHDATLLDDRATVVASIDERTLGLNALRNVIVDHGRHFPHLSFMPSGRVLAYCPNRGAFAKAAMVVVKLAPPEQVRRSFDEALRTTHIIWEFAPQVALDLYVYDPVEPIDDVVDGYREAFQEATTVDVAV